MDFQREKLAMFERKIERVDEIPLILHLLKKMLVAEMIDAVWCSHGNWHGLSYGQLAVLYIAYVVHALTHTLSGMEGWVIKHKTALEHITGWQINDKDATDDRLGIVLGELGKNSEQIINFQNRMGQHLIQAYELPTEVARYDTSSFSVNHKPETNGNSLLDFGHSKDKRPDLLQFKQGLGVLDPAGVPLFTETISGKDADDPLYIPAWRAMAKTIGHTDFLYVADCKAAALDTRATIDKEDGQYLFPLPMTGTTPETLESLVLAPPVTPCQIILEDVIDKNGKPTVVGQGFVVEKDMAAGEENNQHTWKERQLIVRSDAHAERQKKSLMKRLEKAEKKLSTLTPRKDETLPQFQVRAEKILENYSVKKFFELQVEEHVSYQKRYTKSGRPTAKTPYTMVEKRHLQLTCYRDESAIKKQLLLLGWRIYVTNTSEEMMSLQQSVSYYRDQWLVERGFHRFKKGNLPALPLFLRIPERIKGLMLLLTIALQALTLIEFSVRRKLEEEEETLGGLVPGNPKIKTARPTAERILAQFTDLNFLIEKKGNQLAGYLIESLTSLQQRILQLLDIPINIYDLSFNQSVFSNAS